MIVVKIELHPASGGPAQELGRMVIANTGGNREIGEYTVRSRTWESMVEEPDQPSTRRVWDSPELEGSVKGYPRLTAPIWALVARALGSLGF
jgi:hypothetical protein